MNVELALKLCLSALVCLTPIGIVGTIWSRRGQGEVGRIKRQSWAIATVAFALCILGLVAMLLVFVWAVLPELN